MPINNRAAPSGINKDIQRKKAANYPANLEAEARVWIETINGRPLSNQNPGASNFAESLRDGKDLCDLMNKLLEHQRMEQIKVNKGKMAFMMMENISKFLVAVEKYGVANSSLFQTVDLYEERDVGAVVNCLFALGGLATKKGYPVTWGIVVSDPNKRDFDEATLAAGKTVIGLQAGTNQGASQAGSGGFGNTRRL